MIEVFGWLVFSMLVVITLLWTIGALQALASGITKQMLLTVFFFWIILIFFLLTDFNKLHIMWLAPTAFFSSQFIVMAPRIGFRATLYGLLTTIFSRKKRG